MTFVYTLGEQWNYSKVRPHRLRLSLSSLDKVEQGASPGRSVLQYGFTIKALASSNNGLSSGRTTGSTPVLAYGYVNGLAAPVGSIPTQSTKL